MSIKQSIKTISRPIVRFLVSNKYTWIPISWFTRFSGWLLYERSLVDHRKREDKLTVFFKDLTVRTGPFKGLKYPGLVSAGSSIFPKLLGSYEAELHSLLLKIRDRAYSEIIDVGCAEGYYATGLALRYPVSKVYAYDTSEGARIACDAMVAVNGVKDRVHIAGLFDGRELADFHFTGRGLLIIDCEGYEDVLLNSQTINNLLQCDVLVELHPMFVPHIREKLTSLFQATHQIDFFTSYDTRRKVFDFKKDLQGLTEKEMEKCVEEGRAFSMDWLFASAPIA